VTRQVRPRKPLRAIVSTGYLSPSIGCRTAFPSTGSSLIPTWQGASKHLLREKRLMNTNLKRSPKRMSLMSGVSLLELVVALTVISIIAAIAIPNFIAASQAARLKGAVTDFASLVQVQRLRAVDDDRYYSTFLLAAGGTRQAFVDIYPQNNNGTSGTQGTRYTCNQNGCDPRVLISQEVIQQPANNAPNTAALQAQVLPANSPVILQDGGAAGTPVTFGPRGLPCTPFAVVGGIVCDSLGGPAAYWVFFQDNASQNWGAVTVTPAGRVRRWIFTGGQAGTWVSY
jgi:prepilin-type N-terminal cleavage/methylation domain-containing protein